MKVSAEIHVGSMLRVLQLAASAVNTDDDRAHCRSVAGFLDGIGASVKASSGECQTVRQFVEDYMVRGHEAMNPTKCFIFGAKVAMHALAGSAIQLDSQKLIRILREIEAGMLT